MKRQLYVIYWKCLRRSSSTAAQLLKNLDAHCTDTLKPECTFTPERELSSRSF